MAIFKESENLGESTSSKAQEPPRLTVVAAARAPEPEQEMLAEKDWDPYTVWKRLIRPAADQG